MDCKLQLGFVLVFLFFLALVAEERVEAKRRSRGDKRCVVKVKDGRYSVFCTKIKSNRKVSKRGQRHASAKLKKTSKKQSAVKEALEARSIRKKWARNFLRCRNEISMWFKKETFPDNQLRIKCLSKEVLQGFSVQRLLNKIRFKFTCCEFLIFSS